MKGRTSWTMALLSLLVFEAQAATETLEQARTRILLTEMAKMKRQFYYNGPPAGSIHVPYDCLPGELSPAQSSQLAGQGNAPYLAAPSDSNTTSSPTTSTSRAFPFASSAASCGDTVFVSDIGPYRTQSYGNYDGLVVPWWMKPHTGLYWLVDAQTSFLIYNTAISNFNSTYSYSPTIVNAKYVTRNATYSSPIYVTASTTVNEQACQVGLRSCGYDFAFVPAFTPAYIAQGSLAPVQTFSCGVGRKTITIGERSFPEADFLDGRSCIVGADLVYQYDPNDTENGYDVNGTLVAGQRPLATITKGFYQSYALCSTTKTFYSSLSLQSCPVAQPGGFSNPLIDPRALKTQSIDVPTIQLQALALPTPADAAANNPSGSGSTGASGAGSSGGSSGGGAAAAAAAPGPVPASNPSPTQAATAAPASLDSGSGSGSGSVPSTDNSGSGAPVQANNVASVGASNPAGSGMAPGSGQTNSGSISNIGNGAVAGTGPADGSGQTNSGGNNNGNAAGAGSGASSNDGGSKPAAAGIGSINNGVAPGTSGNSGQAAPVTGSAGTLASSPSSDQGGSSGSGIASGNIGNDGNSGTTGNAGSQNPGLAGSTGNTVSDGSTISGAASSNPISGDVQRSEVLAQSLPEGALPVAPALASSASSAATAASQALVAAGITPAPQQQQFTDAAGAIGNLRSASSQLASVASTATGSTLSSVRAAQASIAAVLSSIDAVVATASVSVGRTTTNGQGSRITTSLLVAATALSLRTSFSTNSAGIVSTVVETDILTSSPSATAQVSASASRSSTSRAGAQLTHTLPGTHLSAAMYGLFVWCLAYF